MKYIPLEVPITNALAHSTRREEAVAANIGEMVSSAPATPMIACQGTRVSR
jgi:hypothetical protein